MLALQGKPVNVGDFVHDAHSGEWLKVVKIYPEPDFRGYVVLFLTDYNEAWSMFTSEKIEDDSPEFSWDGPEFATLERKPVKVGDVVYEHDAKCVVKVLERTGPSERCDGSIRCGFHVEIGYDDGGLSSFFTEQRLDDYRYSWEPNGWRKAKEERQK